MPVQIWVANPYSRLLNLINFYFLSKSYQIFMNSQFIKDSSGMDHRINWEYSHVPTLIELYLPSFAQMQSALYFVENVLLQGTVNGNPDKCIKENCQQITNTIPVKNPWF
jgi:hypothetical protein